MATRTLALAALALCTIFATSPARAASAEVYAATLDGYRFVIVDGAIEEDTPIKVEYALRRFGRAGIVLNSKGGELHAAAILADMIKKAELKTNVANGAICASSCFLVLAAGNQITIAPTARIGVHRTSKMKKDEAGGDTIDNTLAEVYQDLRVPKSIINKMLATPHTEIGWLTQGELMSLRGARMLDGPTTTEWLIARAHDRMP